MAADCLGAAISPKNEELKVLATAGKGLDLKLANLKWVADSSNKLVCTRSSR